MLRRQSEMSEEEPVRPLLSLTRELGFVVLLCQLLLPNIFAVLRCIPLLEEGRETHCEKRLFISYASLHIAAPSAFITIQPINPVFIAK